MEANYKRGGENQEKRLVAKRLVQFEVFTTSAWKIHTEGNCQIVVSDSLSCFGEICLS